MPVHYIQMTDAGKGSMALFQRSSDGKYALIKTTWFKKVGEHLIPRSRIKEIRLNMLDWKEEGEII